MLRKRRTVPLRRTLNVEALEDRTLMTGNVTASLNLSGTLFITGDGGGLSSAFPEAVQILDSSPPGLPNLTFRVQGRPGTFTSVNGTQFLDFVGSSITSVIANFPSFGPATFNALDIIGQFPGSPTSGTNFAGSVQVTGGVGKTDLSISNVTTNSVSLLTPASTAGASITLNAVKANLLTTFTGVGADKYTITGTNLALANLNTDGGNDSVTIAGSGVGSLTANSTNGNVTYNISGNILSKATISVGSTGAGTGDDSVTFSGNSIFSGALINVGVGNTAAPRAVALGGHLVNVSSNTGTGASTSLLVNVGNTGGRTNNANSDWATTQVAVNSNKVPGALNLSVGTWAYTVQENGNTAGSMTTNVGNFSGSVFNNGAGNLTPPGTPAVGVDISNDAVAGALNVTVGTATPGVGAIGGGIAFNMNTITARTMNVTLGDMTNANPLTGGNTFNSVVGIQNVSLTGALPAGVANTISIAFDPLTNTGLNHRNGGTTINNILSPAANLNIQVAAGVFGGLGVSNGGTVTINGIVTDELNAFLGQNYSTVNLTNSSTVPDANGAGDMILNIGTVNGGSSSVTVANDNVGNAASGNLSITMNQTAADVVQWLIQNVKTFDWNMAAGNGTGGTNIATLNGISVLDFMLVQFGNGFNGVQATNVVVSPGFGILNGGGNPGSVYIGSPTDFGYVVFGFGAYF